MSRPLTIVCSEMCGEQSGRGGSSAERWTSFLASRDVGLVDMLVSEHRMFHRQDGCDSQIEV